MKSKNRALTLIELIITIVVLAVVMIPLGVICVEYMTGVFRSRDFSVVEGLAKTELSKVNNLAYSDGTLADGYDNTTSNYEGYSYDLRRTVSYVAGWSNNLKQVQVRVYPSGETVSHLVNVVSYVANVSYGAGSQGGPVSTGDEASSLVVSGGSISGADLQNVTLENTDSNPITITGVIISFTGQSGVKLKTITMDGTERWSGTAASGATITFDANFTLSGSTTYSNTGLFHFSKNITSVSSLVFIMSDASQTSSYSW